MNDQILFLWDLHYACNYRCPYCWWHGRWQDLVKLNRYSLKEWVSGWTNVYEKYGSVHIEISGGEPFIYPNFIELTKQLSQMHALRITTNLSVDIEDFIDQIDPKKVKVTSTFHPLFADLGTFIKKIRLLKEKGFSANICYLAYPPQMVKIEYLSKHFRDVGINFALVAFWGEYNGKKYPAAYTQDEKKMMHPYPGDIDRITYRLDAQGPRGKLCNAGYKYASIQGNGSVVRCGSLSDKPIGNILEDNFRLLDKPSPCEADFCLCNEYVCLLDNSKSESIQIFPESSAGTNFNKIDLGPINQFKISFTWDIHYSCNYRCSYCFFIDRWAEISKENRYPNNIGKLIDIWWNIYKRYGKCHIHITGGEPFIYPNFLDLLRELSKMFSIEFDTNLSFDIGSFLDAIGLTKTTFNASYHPEFIDFDKFLNKAIALKNNAHIVNINYVGYPPFLKHVREYKEKCKGNINFNILPFRGTFEGRIYPMAYNESEKEIVSISSSPHTTKQMTDWYDSGKLVNAREKESEKICYMGQFYSKIHPSGEAYRCCIVHEDGKLGNLLDGTFALWDAPRPCKYDRCSCWRSPIVGQEDRWENFWLKEDEK